MGKKGSGRGRGREAALRAHSKRLLGIVWKLVVFMGISMLAILKSAWNWTYEPVGFRCRHEPLPVNNSGVKVLVYGMAKTGTTSMARTLGKLYNKSWKATDANIHIIAPMADEYWQDPKNGGGMFPWQRLAFAGAPAYMRGTYAVHSVEKELPPDVEMVLNFPRAREALADRFSRCRVDTMAFDGGEHLFWPLYEVSPDAKVVMLNWRTYQERQRSSASFGQRLNLFYQFMGMGSTSTQYLPFPAVFLPILDALTGNRLLHWASNGTQAVKIDSWLYNTWRQSLFERRVLQHRQGGLGLHISSEEDYSSYWEEGKRRIPKDRLLEFDMKRSTVKDLCKFLEIGDNPECDIGGVPNKQIFGLSESEQPEQFLILVPSWLFCYWATWKVLFVVLEWPLRILIAILCQLFPPKNSRKLT